MAKGQGPLRYALLGLLAGSPGTGYALKKRFAIELADAWYAETSQIYPERARVGNPLRTGLRRVARVGRSRGETRPQEPRTVAAQGRSGDVARLAPCGLAGREAGDRAAPEIRHPNGAGREREGARLQAHRGRRKQPGVGRPDPPDGAASSVGGPEICADEPDSLGAAATGQTDGGRLPQ